MRQDQHFIDKKIQLPFKVKGPVLALGPQAKNTLCFATDSFAYLGSGHSNLSNLKDFLNFEKDLKYFLRKKPKIIAVDLHPEYQSTKYVDKMSLDHPACPAGRQVTRSPVQHHHAHIASCMAENGLKNEKVIGVAFDGTGLGADNRIWGAEFLVCNYRSFQRRAHLREIPLLGAEKAIQEPWRLACVWLYLAYQDRLFGLDIPFVKSIDKKKWQALKSILASEFSPLASSMGRLFDAVGTLVLNKKNANFEAELAIELEKISHVQYLAKNAYAFRIRKDNVCYIIDPEPTFKEIVADLKAKRPKEEIAYRFHLTVAEIIKDTCLKLRRETQINKAVLSGGVFQNKLLLKLAQELLTKKGFIVFTHQRLSSSDAGLSLGQAAIAGFRSQRCV